MCSVDNDRIRGRRGVDSDRFPGRRDVENDKFRVAGHVVVRKSVPVVYWQGKGVPVFGGKERACLALAGRGDGYERGKKAKLSKQICLTNEPSPESAGCPRLRGSRRLWELTSGRLPQASGCSFVLSLPYNIIDKGPSPDEVVSSWSSIPGANSALGPHTHKHRTRASASHPRPPPATATNRCLAKDTTECGSVPEYGQEGPAV